MLTLQTSTNYLGKCKTRGCMHATHTSLEDVQLYDLSTRLTFDGEKVDTTQPFKGGNGPVCAKCPEHGVYELKAVKGRLVEDHVCDARCTGATGPSCDCSCGGANHGIAHAS